MGRNVFLVTADGDIVENPRDSRRDSRKGEKQLAKAQCKVSRRKQGSHRRVKAGQQCGQQPQNVTRQRTDFPHQTALALVRAYDPIYLEDVPVRTMVRNQHRAKRISDAGWSAFRTILTILDAKAAWARRQVMAVPPAYTSQDGSGGGGHVPKSLSVRTHVCPCCRLVIDRAEHAARNIQWAGQALRGLAGLPAGTNREAPCL